MGGLSMERILFVTGKLAEPSLRRTLTDLVPRLNIEAEVAVLPITVAALMTTDWIARHLPELESIDRIILPGLCRGEATIVQERFNVRTERGPKDHRDLPTFFGLTKPIVRPSGEYDIEILAEINSASRLSREQLLAQAKHFQESGADLIDLGCDPDEHWHGVGDAVQALRQAGHRVSIDSFNPQEVEAALAAGAERVLSVNSSNVERVPAWLEINPKVEVVAIPDHPTDLNSLERTIDCLKQYNVPFHADAILEPIAFGFAASLGRYVELRKQHPDWPMMMGVGNLTELTDVDSAGVNVMLAGFCQELTIGSILTTEVINWSRSAVREFDLARRLTHHAVRESTLPKHLEPRLLMLRDPRIVEQGQAALDELAGQLRDRNYRIFAERGEIHIMNGEFYFRGNDPFALLAQLQERDSKLTASHAFYLGYEMSKAITALTLGKQYRQDNALSWGFLTKPERNQS